MKRLLKILLVLFLFIFSSGFIFGSKDGIYSKRYKDDYTTYIDSAWANRLIHEIAKEFEFFVTCEESNGGAYTSTSALFTVSEDMYPSEAMINLTVTDLSDANMDGVRFFINLDGNWHDNKLKDNVAEFIARTIYLNPSSDFIDSVHDYVSGEKEETLRIDGDFSDTLIIGYYDVSPDGYEPNYSIEYIIPHIDKLNIPNYTHTESPEGLEKLYRTPSYKEMTNPHETLFGEFYKFDVLVNQVLDTEGATSFIAYIDGKQNQPILIRKNERFVTVDEGDELIVYGQYKEIDEGIPVIGVENAYKNGQRLPTRSEQR